MMSWSSPSAAVVDGSRIEQNRNTSFVSLYEMRWFEVYIDRLNMWSYKTIISGR